MARDGIRDVATERSPEAPFARDGGPEARADAPPPPVDTPPPPDAPPASAPDDTLSPASGTRLRLRLTTTADGARMREPGRGDFYDRERKELCSVREAFEKGALHCTPVAELTRVSLNDPAQLFADQACAVPLIPHTASYLLIDTQAAGCVEPWSPLTYYGHGAAHAGAVYHRLPGGACEETAASGGPYDCAEVVPAVAFVRFGERKVAASAGVEARALVGVDGARLPVGFWSPRFLAPCRIRDSVAGSAALKCLPAEALVVAATTFEEGSCTKAVAARQRCAPSSFVVQRAVSATCASASYQLFLAGAELGTIYRALAPCKVVPGPHALRYHAVGAPLAAEDFPDGRLVEAGGTRLRYDQQAIGDWRAPFVLDGVQNPRDGTLGVECRPGVAADGKRRCLPVAEAAAYFGDAKCTVPLAGRARVAPAPGDCTPPRHVLVTAADGRSAVFALGPETTAGVFEKGPSGCAALTAEALAATQFFTLGAEVPPATMVELVDTVE